MFRHIFGPEAPEFRKCFFHVFLLLCKAEVTLTDDVFCGRMARELFNDSPHVFVPTHSQNFLIGDDKQPFRVCPMFSLLFTGVDTWRSCGRWWGAFQLVTYRVGRAEQLGG